EQRKIESGSGFSTSGHVRAIETTQILRAAQVGGLTDARLEVNCYHLLQTLRRSAGPWIGDPIELGTAQPFGRLASVGELLSRPGRRMFEQAAATESREFLEL